MDLAGKVVVVTGGGNGIGQQLVLALLTRQASVAAVDINTAGLQETKSLAGPRSHKLSLHQADISDRESVAQLVDAVLGEHTCVDALINNAGVIHPFVPVNELDFEIIDRILKVNLNGVINMTKMFLPHLLARPVAHIVNISSMGGLFAFPKQTIYGATKAAVKLFSEGLYSELRGTNVGVTVVFPGAVKTNITKNCNAHPDALDKFERFHPGIAPEKVANRIVSAIEKNSFRLHIGIDSKFLSFFYRVAPGLAIRFLAVVMDKAMSDSH